MRLHGQRIIKVEKRPSLWCIQTGDGEKYATKEPWLAALAERVRETRAIVTLDWQSGWYYRDLRAIDADTAAESV